LPELLFDNDYLAGLEEEVFNQATDRIDAGCKVVGVYCAFTPKELIAAAGAIPVSLCASSEKTIADAEAHLPRNLCPLIKSSYGFALTDTCPYFHDVDFFLPTSPATVSTKMFELLGRIKPLHLLQLPQTSDTREAFQYWLKELQGVKELLEARTGNRVTEAALGNHIRLYNKFRKTAEEVFAFNRGEVPLLYGREINVITNPAGFECDLPWRIDGMHKAMEQARERATKAEFLQEMARKPRILLTGCPNTNRKILNAIEEDGGVVAAMENCGGLPMLTIRNLSKRFGPTEVLKSINLEIKAGEIHELVGVNGSGKSTLLHVLFGTPIIAQTGGYSGEILLDKVKVELSSPRDAIKHGIGMIHQEFALIPDLTVAENVKMTREKVYPLTERCFGRTFACINTSQNHTEVLQILQRLGMDVAVDQKVSGLPVNAKQFVEIARELDKARLAVLLLDEPTAVLNREDSQRLVAILKDLACKGTAILFVSHRLEEITALCDRATVLRNGEVVESFERAEFDPDRMAEAMVGRRVIQTERVKRSRAPQPIMKFVRFGVDMPGEALQGMDLELLRGEILGVASLSGHGKLALGAGVVGLFETRGEVFCKGDLLELKNTRATLARGVCFFPEERKAMGLLLHHTVMENIVFGAVQSRNRFLREFPWPALRLFDRRKALIYAQDCTERFGITCRSVTQEVAELSGGNQQKVCIARALALEPEVLFISEPTRGIDIGAKEIILETLLDINHQLGTTIVIASSELDELKRICDRIVVLYRGSIFAVIPPDVEDKALALALSGEWRQME
jgi:simple sugar transport system ATP-binding protein